MIRALSLLLLAAAAPLSAQTTAALSPEIPSVADSLKRAVPGTRVRMAPPPGFIPTVRFSGFQDTRSIAAITVVVLPVPFADVARRFTAQALAERGQLELRSSSPLRVDGHPAVLVLTRGSAGGMRFEKQLLAFGHDSATVLITANYPDSSVARLREPIRRSVLSADWSGTGPVDVIIMDLPFEVTEAPGLKRVGRITNTVVFTESGIFPGQPGEAVAAVGVSLQPAELGDLAAFSRDRLRQTPYLSDFSVRSGAPVEIGGRAAYELVADARETRRDVAMVVYQVVIPDGSGYTLFQAQVGADRADRFLPRFREMARSLRLRRPAGR